jgi:hypothetical protein
MAAPKGNQYAKGLTKAMCNTGTPEKYTKEWCDQEAKALLEWIKDDKNDPHSKIYLGSFALERGYHRARFLDFKEKSEDFRNAYQQAQTWQEQKFIINGLTKKWDPTFTAYVMARVCAPEWKKTWDKEEEKTSVAPMIVINKIEK